MEEPRTFAPKYSAASILFWVLSLLGWLTLLAGLFLAAFMLAEANHLQGLARLAVTLPGIGVAFGGVFIVVVAEIGDAVIDTANNTAETVYILKRLKQADV